VVENTVLGAFFLASVRPDAFTEYHRNRLLDTLMNQLSLAAYNSLLYSRSRVWRAPTGSRAS